MTWSKQAPHVDVCSSKILVLNGELNCFRELDSRFKRLGSGSLQIADVQEADAGVYQCRAENTEDSVDVTVSLDVLVSPRFLKRPASLSAHEKEDAEFECQVYATPEATVQWLKNGELIIESEYFQVIVMEKPVGRTCLSNLRYFVADCKWLQFKNPWAGSVRSGHLPMYRN